MITLYTQPNCLPCKRIKTKFDQAGIDYQIIDIAADEQSKNYILETLKARSVPVITTDIPRIPVVRGYQPDKVQQIINWYNEQLALFDIH